jgi:hypothetical protein
MATYQELFSLASSSTIGALRQRIIVAISIKAQAIAELPTPTAEQKAWARQALGNPQSFEQTILHYVLADNAAATVAQIEGATDVQVQTAVNTAVDNLLGS